MSSLEAPVRVLILGGSSESSALAAALAGVAGVRATLSLAGRTAAPAAQPLPTRVGGFGGIAGLAAYLADEGVDVLVDATHPFAAQMTEHARAAAQLAGCRLLAVARPDWVPHPGDRWRKVATMADAAASLGKAPRRVFLTIGRLQLPAFAAAPQHDYLVRTIDAVAPGHGLARVSFLEARGPFALADELKLMRAQKIDVLVSKDSGGDAVAAKLVAARQLGLPVVLVARPQGSGGDTLAATIAAILAHAPSTRRGV